MRIAVLDDYQKLAFRLADWSAVRARCDVTVFDRHLSVPDEAAEALADFDIICLLRERMAFPRALIERLPKLKMIASTSTHNRTLDLQAATEHGIVCMHTLRAKSGNASTAELAWGLILSLSRHIPREDRAMRQGAWQTTLGRSLEGRTLGLLGLGRLGREMVPVARAFRMNVIAWSQNLTPEKAAAEGVEHVNQDALFARSDVLSVHVVLSERTRHLVGARELALMKPDAVLVNTARGPIVDPDALYEALRTGRIAGAGLDVYEEEPLPAKHRLRNLDTVVLTPHLGYVVEDLMREFYVHTVENILAFLSGAPARVFNPEVVPRHG
jgi:phosphoglycerate dehydrogenase-like enzyme